MDPKRTLRIATLVAITPLTLLACSASEETEQEAVGVTVGELNEPQTSGFVTPSLAPADEARVFASGYTHLDPGRVVPDNLLLDAVAYFDANKARFKNKAHIAITDFAKPSGKKRFYVIDMATGKVTPHMVAHGSGSETNGNAMASRFSDTDGSHMSSLGFVVTGSTCQSNHGRSLLLYGLSTSNAHMRSREIIIHGAAYVNEGNTSRQGNSWGCFALDQRIKDQVITDLQNGALLYAGLGKPNAGARPTAADGPPPGIDTPDDDNDTPPATDAGTPASGRTCHGDYDCNPGNDGSGMICVAGVCTPGCKTNAQCPGSTTCQAGMCK